LAGATELYDPLIVPPWAHAARKEDPQVGFKNGLTKEQAAQDFKSWLQRQNPLDLVVYTDGSQVAHPRRAAGAGWALCWGQGHPIVTTGNQSLPKAEVFDAEAVAALRGLQNAITCFQAKYANNILICLDNLEIARILGSTASTSSQQVFAQFQEAEKAWQTRERLPHTSQGREESLSDGSQAMHRRHSIHVSLYTQAGKRTGEMAGVNCL
jgi:hypothetical protein